MVFHRFCLVSVLVLKGKPKENYWKTNPSRLRDLSGASFWAPLASACSGAPSPGLLLSLSLLAPSGLLWLALVPSILSLSSFTRNKEEIRLWGLSGASVWALCLFSSRVTERGEYRMGCSGPAGTLLSRFLLLSLLWGSFSGTSPESLLVVWPPGLLWLALAPSFLSLCLLLRVIRKKSDSVASLELPSGPSVFSLSRVTERGRIPSGPLLSLFLLLSLL